ncbi:MAG: ferritin-like domain-containing protein [Chloroflexota bacterium]
MTMSALYDVYVEQLKDMYSAEKQLAEALPKMAKAASTDQLQQAFEKHLSETRDHLNKVQAILDELDENPGNKHCKGMEGLVKEGEHVIKKEGSPAARDVAIILAAQKVEHYEIATYGGLRAYARTLGYDAAADTLDEILDQEYDADQKLDDIAEGGALEAGLNEEAVR